MTVAGYGATALLQSVLRALQVLDAMRLLIESILREADVGGDTFMETPGAPRRRASRSPYY